MHKSAILNTLAKLGPHNNLEMPDRYCYGKTAIVTMYYSFLLTDSPAVPRLIHLFGFPVKGPLLAKH